MKKNFFVRFCITSAILAAALLFVYSDVEQKLYNISISPNDQYLYEGTPVTIEIRNLQSFNLKWEFDDGTDTRGGSKQIHTFQRPGNFNVRVYDESGSGNPIVVIKIKHAALRPDGLLRI